MGAACAAALAEDGWRVTILERSFAAAGTTSVGMGHVVAMDDSPEQLALTAYSARLWSEFVPELGRVAEFDPCGTLWLAENDEQFAAVREKQRVYASAGVATELLDQRSVQDAEPNVREGLVGALRVPGDSVVYPPGVTLRLIELAVARGAKLRAGVEVLEIRPNSVRCAGETLHADVVVNAAGAMAATLTPKLRSCRERGISRSRTAIPDSAVISSWSSAISPART